MSDSEKAILIFGLLGLGLLFLFTRSSSGRYSEEASYPEEESTAIPLRPISSRKAHQYTNKEKWDIKWNEDGLPIQVTIERDAVQT